MAAGVVDHGTLLDRLAAVHAIALHQGAAGRVHFHFERHTKFAAVTKHGEVLGGQTGGAGIKIIAFVERTTLGDAVGHFHAGAIANGPIAPTGPAARFEHHAGVSGLGKLPGGDQPGDSCAEDHHRLAGTRSRRQLYAARFAGRNRQ